MADFIYNGARLTDIYSVYTPELQKSHPFAFVTENHGNYHLYLSTVPLTRRLDGYQYMERTESGSVIAYKLKDSEWQRYPENDHEITSGNGIGFWTFIVLHWSNFDIYNSDGTLYLAASDPVPVTTINPSALMQGFFVGDAIKRMR